MRGLDAPFVARNLPGRATRAASRLAAAMAEGGGRQSTGARTEPQWVDAWIEPLAGRPRLPGLLGRMVTEPCGVEVFYGAVGLADAIACPGEQAMGKYHSLAGVLDGSARGARACPTRAAR